MNCYLSKNYINRSNAGNKAKTDIENILQKDGFKNVGLKQTAYTNKIIGFLLTLIGVLKAFFYLHKGDILLIQYPLKKYYIFICKIAHFNGAKVITLIHDLGSFRREKLTIKEEIKHLNNSNYIIAHNLSMKSWLQKQGCTPPIACLQIFDYLSNTTADTTNAIKRPYGIVYAGALSSNKNAFLYELDNHIENYHLYLYGKGFEIEKIKNKEYFTYKGFTPSDELIEKAEGSFGLVWDGNSINTCSGNWGEYLKYNNPHKTSLYIRCQLPIIIWKEAALASFITEKNIGICINSLEELNIRLATISNEEYTIMKNNIIQVSNQLAHGFYTKKVIKEVITSSFQNNINS